MVKKEALAKTKMLQGRYSWAFGSNECFNSNPTSVQKKSENQCNHSELVETFSISFSSAHVAHRLSLSDSQPYFRANSISSESMNFHGFSTVCNPYMAIFAKCIRHMGTVFLQ